MKVLLISPDSRAESSVKEIPMVTPPINLMYLAEVIRRNNYDVKILDAYALNIDDSKILNFVKNFRPDVILIPLYSRDLLSIYNLTYKLKMQNPKMVIILGGHHASHMPDAVLKEFNQVDYVLRGEAEQSIIGLLKCIDKEGKGLNNVKGLSYRKEKSKIRIHNKPQPPIEDLDSLPIPSRDLIISKNYYSRLSKRNPLDIIITSRGCPSFCSFCPKLGKNFNRYRVRSPENVIEELREILSHGAKSIEFYDESFSINKNRCLKLIDLIKKEKMDFECRVRTRTDSIDAEILRELKTINCTTMSYGVESGNQKVLDINGKGLKINQIKKAFDTTHKMGINILAFFLIGFPQDTPNTIRETINLSKKLNPKYAVFNLIKPFPGTRIYLEAKKNNTLIGDWSIHQNIPWVKLPWVETVDEVYKYVDLAYHEFYYRPRFVFNFFKDTIKRDNWSQLVYTLKHSLKNVRTINLES